MRRAIALLVVLCAVSVVSAVAVQQTAGLSVVSSGPTGEVASLGEAREIRFVFSEPMVVLGRIPQPVVAPFVSISPTIAGTYRWSGTTVLIFTPDPTKQ